MNFVVEQVTVPFKLLKCVCRLYIPYVLLLASGIVAKSCS